MSANAQVFAAELIQGGASAIAAQAAGALVEGDEAIAARWSPRAFEHWKADLAGRLAYLAVAVRAGRPELFASHLRWSLRAFAAREVPADDLALAIDRVREAVLDALPPMAHDAVLRVLDAGAAVLEEPVDERPVGRLLGAHHAELGQRYMLALLEGDRDRASRLIMQAVEGGVSVPEIYAEVLGPVQQELGELWMAGDIHIGAEHFATETTRHVMSQLFPVIARTPKREGRVALAASVDGNQHDIGIRMVADLLEMDGWRPVYLGASVPAPDLVETAIDFGVDLVVLSAMLALHVDAAREAIAVFRECPQTCDLPIIVGGPAFADAPGLWAEIGADGFADRAAEIARVAERLIATRS